MLSANVGPFETEGIAIRNLFRTAMDHFDFLNVFRSRVNDDLCPVYCENTMRVSDIANFTQHNGKVRRVEDGGCIISRSDVMLYSVNAKWVAKFCMRNFAIKTSEPVHNHEFIIVYDSLDAEIRDTMDAHSSFDGKMKCWYF
jgi:hypothetical protein